MNAPRPIPPHVPPLELECLRVLWRLGKASVHDVRAALGGRRDLAYTTVMTLLERLERKGAAMRRKEGRAFLYAPAVDRETLRQHAVSELVAIYFDDGIEELREWLRPARPQDASASREDLDTALL